MPLVGYQCGNKANNCQLPSRSHLPKGSSGHHLWCWLSPGNSLLFCCKNSLCLSSYLVFSFTPIFSFFVSSPVFFSGTFRNTDLHKILARFWTPGMPLALSLRPLMAETKARGRSLRQVALSTCTAPWADSFHTQQLWPLIGWSRQGRGELL